MGKQSNKRIKVTYSNVGIDIEEVEILRETRSTVLIDQGGSRPYQYLKDQKDLSFHLTIKDALIRIKKREVSDLRFLERKYLKNKEVIKNKYNNVNKKI